MSGVSARCRSSAASCWHGLVNAAPVMRGKAACCAAFGCTDSLAGRLLATGNAIAAAAAAPCQRPSTHAPKATAIINPPSMAGLAIMSIRTSPSKSSGATQSDIRGGWGSKASRARAFKPRIAPHRSPPESAWREALVPHCTRRENSVSYLGPNPGERGARGSRTDQARAIACIRSMMSSAWRMIRSISSLQVGIS